MSVGIAIYFESLYPFQIQNLWICGYVLRLEFFQVNWSLPLVNRSLSGNRTKGLNETKHIHGLERIWMKIILIYSRHAVSHDFQQNFTFSREVWSILFLHLGLFSLKTCSVALPFPSASFISLCHLPGFRVSGYCHPIHACVLTCHSLATCPSAKDRLSAALIRPAKPC